MACHADRPAGRRPDELGAALFINQHFGCRCTNSAVGQWQEKKEGQDQLQVRLLRELII